MFRKRIRKNLVYIITFVFKFLCAGDYLKCINKTTTSIQICTGLVLGILMCIFDSKGFVSFFLFCDISEKYLQFIKKKNIC